MQERPRIQSSDLRPGGMRPSESASRQAVRPAVVSPGFWRRWWRVVLIAVVLAAGIGYLLYGYITTRNELARLSGSKGGQEETKQLTGEIGKYIQLPDEVPTLATVNDAERLKTQEFFRNAQNGDRVLIFSGSGRALLYRPSTKRVIEYAKVDLNTTKPQ